MRTTGLLSRALGQAFWPPDRLTLHRSRRPVHNCGVTTQLKFLYRAYRYRYRVDSAELRFIGERLRPGQVAVDAGCHKGAYTYWMQRRVRRLGQVIAFEPQPSQVRYLQRAFAAMRYRNVMLVPMALSDAPGKLKLNIPTGEGFSTHGASLVSKDSPGASWDAVDVDVTTLDAFLAEQNGKDEGVGSLLRMENAPSGNGLQSQTTPDPVRCDFIKIDVEGHELAVLEGARRTLEQYRPTLVVECEARHRPDNELRPVFDFLASFGYEGSFFQSGRRHPLSDFNLAEHQPRIARNEKPPAGYVNNFAFELA